MSREFDALSFNEQTMCLRAETYRQLIRWMCGEREAHPCGSIAAGREWLPPEIAKRIAG